jgi:uncharacterized protein YdeI (YjbR/CyaY-like superfamily)
MNLRFNNGMNNFPFSNTPMATDKRIDTYIERAEPFAQPILRHLRKLIHKACPSAEETIKWQFASFDYKGPLCSMAAFKKHVAFGFWKHALLNDPQHYMQPIKADGGKAMGNLGRITSIKDLPADKIIIGFVRQAMALNEQGIKVVKKSKPKPVLREPAYFKKALALHPEAREKFAAFSPSQKREYLEWITEAKTEVTRNKRLTQAVAWISEGKPRNWKYMKKY